MSVVIGVQCLQQYGSLFLRYDNAKILWMLCLCLCERLSISTVVCSRLRFDGGVNRLLTMSTSPTMPVVQLHNQFCRHIAPISRFPKHNISAFLEWWACWAKYFASEIDKAYDVKCAAPSRTLARDVHSPFFWCRRVHSPLFWFFWLGRFRHIDKCRLRYMSSANVSFSQMKKAFFHTLYPMRFQTLKQQ